MQLGRAIARAHDAGIIHRDLKPDNIFLVREDDQELAKVLDFGIAKATGPRFGGMETRTGVTMGTPYYMSPEQVEGKKALDHRSDLWSLAVITCECMTGVRPFDGETFGELLLNICARPVQPPSSQGLKLPGFDQWFAKAANRDPAQRFNSAQEMAAALADVVSGRARLAAPPAVPPATQAMSPQTAANVIPARTLSDGSTADALEVRVPMQQSRVWPLLLGSLVLLLIGLGAWLAFGRAKSEHAEADGAKLVPAAGSASAQPVAAGTPLVPALSASPAAESGGKPSVKAARAPLGPTEAQEARPSAATPAARVPAVTSAGSAQPKSERCYADPFTGQIRLAGAGHAADSFACRQNAFTGAYQRQ